MNDVPFRERVYVGSWTNAALVNNLLEREGLSTIVVAARESRYQRAVYVLDPDHVEHARNVVATSAASRSTIRNRIGRGAVDRATSSSKDSSTSAGSAAPRKHDDD